MMCPTCGKPMLSEWPHQHDNGTAEIDRHTGRPLPVQVWDPDPLTIPEPPSDLPSSSGTAVWIVAAGLVGIALVVGIAGYLASRS